MRSGRQGQRQGQKGAKVKPLCMLRKGIGPVAWWWCLWVGVSIGHGVGINSSEDDC